MSRYVIEKNFVISINRGDYLEKEFLFTTGPFLEEVPLIVNEGDVIFFGLMDPHQHFEHALIKKEFGKKDITDEGLFTLILESEDTLDLVPGTYYYSIKLLTKDSKIKTLIPKSKFIIVD